MFSNNQNISIWYSWTLKSKFLKVVFLTAMWNYGLWSKNTSAWMEMLTVKDTTQIEYKYFPPSHFVFFVFFFWRYYIKRTQLFENMLQLAFYKVLFWTKLILTTCHSQACTDYLPMTLLYIITLQHSRLKMPEICSFQSWPLMPKSARTL